MEEISETQKQYEEVKSKFMGTPLWMKAPNGKRTNLTEEQWVRARTPNFKRWFDDWEMLAEAYPEHEIFDIDEAYKFARGSLQGGEFTSKDGHTATLGRSGIDKMNSGLARGKTGNNRLHALAFANVGKLFENSELLEAEPPRDGDSNIKQYLKFYAPLYMDGRFYVVKITARELYSGNKLYSLEGLDIIEESEYRGQPRGSKENSISADYSDSVKNFVKKIREVKGNVSKVVDENGEPKVVYHGSPYYGFTIFKNESYFTAQKNYAARYKKGGNNSGIYDVFLDIKNPFDTRSKREREIFEKEFYRKWGNGAPLTERGLPDWTDGSDLLEFIEEKGYNYDGIILDEGADGGYGETVSFRGESYVPLNSNQIKSATDNIGTYSENPDIRWRIEEGAAELDARHAELYERYKGGDEAAYGEALELVADEARRKGYDVKVYHGTGSNGFNIADATGKNAYYGEGQQAHGMGLYIAESRNTAENYRKIASGKRVLFIDGRGYYDVKVPWGLDKKYAKEYFLDNAKESGNKELVETIEKSKKLEVKKSKGHLFDWFTNLTAENTLDEQLPFSKQNVEVKKKLRKLFKDNGKDLTELMKTGYVRGNPTGGQIYGEVQSVLAHGSEAEASRLLSKCGIKGIIYDGGQDGRVFVSFEGEATVKLQDPFTFDDEGNLIPLSERFDETNPDMRWKIDDEALGKIKSLSSADIEGIMDEAERVVADNLKESKGRSAAKLEVDREKYIRDNMPEWKDNPDAFDEEDYAKGYRNYWNRRGYDIVYTPEDGWYSVVDENGDSLKDFRTLEEAEEYALERWWDDNVYDELDYKEDYNEDNPQNLNRKKFEYAAKRIGVDVLRHEKAFTGSEYVWIKLPNGLEKKIRFADHPQVYSADMSVEEDWRAAFKFFVERVQREDWTEENYPDNIRWKIDDPSPERVEKLRAARPVEIGENDYNGLYELNAKSAREYVLKKLRGRKYVNADTGDEIEIGQVGARKLLSHDRYNKDYLRSFVAIPQMIENAVYLGEEPNEKGNGKYDKYRYYACGLKIGGRDYTARLTIGESEGKWYYDQALTQIEKGDLIKRLLTLNSRVRPLTGSPNGFIDNRLISLLQENNSENSSRLRYLLRQDRRENPVIWASIVLAKQILLGRAITSARLDRVLPPERFDGTKREYAVNRAREIAERYRADKEKFGNDLNLGVQRAENDLYWTRDVVEEMYASFRRDGEEYGIARQRLMEWLKEQRRRDLETVKGLSSEELGIDVPAAIEDALEKEPERRKPGENAAEESYEETFEASGEGIDAEIESAREKPAPSSIRDIIGKIRAGVTKAAKARGMDEAARRRAYRNTLAEVLRESAKRLTYGREREAIMKKISDLSAKGYSVIKIKDGERAGQKIDNYTLRAEHIALRIFNRGVRDTKRELSEKFEKIVSRKGKKPSRMERDDKRALAGAVQMRVYNIKRYSEMDAAELEAEYSATVDRLENVEKNFAEDAGKGEVRSDIEDIRAEVANANAGEKLPSESARGIRGKSCIFATFIYRKFTAKFSPRKQAFPAPPAQIQFFSNLFKFTLTY